MHKQSQLFETLRCRNWPSGRNFDSSQAAFEEMRKKDPYRLTSLDTYSNILFVKEMEL